MDSIVKATHIKTIVVATQNEKKRRKCWKSLKTFRYFA